MNPRDQIARAAALLSELRAELLAVGHDEAARLVQSAFRSVRSAGRLFAGTAASSADSPGSEPSDLAGEPIDTAGLQQAPAKARRAARRARRLDEADSDRRPRLAAGHPGSEPAPAPLGVLRSDQAALLEVWLREIRRLEFTSGPDEQGHASARILDLAARFEPLADLDASERTRVTRWLVRAAARRVTPGPLEGTLSHADHLLNAREILARASDEMRARKAS